MNNKSNEIFMITLYPEGSVVFSYILLPMFICSIYHIYMKFWGFMFIYSSINIFSVIKFVASFSFY